MTLEPSQCWPRGVFHFFFHRPTNPMDFCFSIYPLLAAACWLMSVVRRTSWGRGRAAVVAPHRTETEPVRRPCNAPRAARVRSARNNHRSGTKTEHPISYGNLKQRLERTEFITTLPTKNLTNAQAEGRSEGDNSQARSKKKGNRFRCKKVPTGTWSKLACKSSISRGSSHAGVTRRPANSGQSSNWRPKARRRWCGVRAAAVR